MTELRSLIAETLAAHIRGHEGPPGVGRWFCTCAGWSKPLVEGSSIADFRLHVADAILAALDGRILPDGGETWYEADCPDADCRRHARSHHTHRRTRIEWPDGGWYAGPWRTVESEATP